jgi:hypothetical protein
MYQELKKWDWPDWAVYRELSVSRRAEGKLKRKARRGDDARTELPSAAEAIPLFDPVVHTLGDYMVDLTTLREAYANVRFEADWGTLQPWE